MLSEQHPAFIMRNNIYLDGIQSPNTSQVQDFHAALNALTIQLYLIPIVLLSIHDFDCSDPNILYGSTDERDPSILPTGVSSKLQV